MSKAKFHTCNEPECRTLTSGKFCAAHREPEQTAEAKAQAAADLRFEEIKAGELLSRQWEENVDQIDAMRAELAELREYGARTKPTEQPVFSNQFSKEFHE